MTIGYTGNDPLSYKQYCLAGAPERGGGGTRGSFPLLLSNTEKRTEIQSKNHLLYANLTTRCQKVEIIGLQTNSIGLSKSCINEATFESS